MKVSMMEYPFFHPIADVVDQYVEFGGAGYGEDEDEMEIVSMPGPNAQKANVQPTKSLEALVLAKNKRVLDELTKLRVRRLH